MENRGLLFIPDISGFTRFVTETEIDHSRLIIQELLELLINSNQLDLEVSEVEGDAILFYRFGDSPSPGDIYKQVAKMFCEFHKALIAYDHRRYCQCTACAAAIGLTLKVITHYGEFTGYNVKTFNKLIGRDVIVAHQLLKNDINSHEYWLATNSLFPDGPPPNLAGWIEWNDGIKKTEAGDVAFSYAQLTELKKEVVPDPLPPLDFQNKTKVLSIAQEYETDIITLFHAVGDFNYRNRWEEGVKKVEEVNHFLPRVGMQCRCIYENGASVIYATSYTFTDDRISFSETDHDKKNSRHFLLEKLGEKRTRLTIEHYIRKKPFASLLFRFTNRQKLHDSYQRSLDGLQKVIAEIKL